MKKLREELQNNKNAFLEIDKQLSKVLQIWPYRIVIVLPPLSQWIEITIVKPIIKLSLEDYNLDVAILDLLKDNAKWILISWAPGEGKTTFAQALIEDYVKQDKIIKTIESPRDLIVSNEVTQYSFSHAPHSEIKDILLLSRPDWTVYDEIRNTEDFILFKDLRLTGIWLIGVIHATNPVDSVQRFLWTIEMWVIPQVVDTIIFIKSWKIDTILKLSQVIKTPEWMESNDLARPVILVSNFETQKVEYEIYTYWEQIVVMPLNKITKTNTAKNWLVKFACKYLKDYLWHKYNFGIFIKPQWLNTIKLFVNTKFKWQIIWRWWENIMKLEKELWLSISIRTLEDLPIQDTKIIIENYKKWKNNFLNLIFPEDFIWNEIGLLVWDEIIEKTVNYEWKIVINNNWLINKITKFWVKLIDMD
jgi:ATPase